jgi:hypothetical protein
LGRRCPFPDAIADRDRAILDIARQSIRAAGRRVRGSEIRLADRAAGGGWGDSVIIRVLADLVAASQLVNKYDGKGYGLPAEKGDLDPAEAAGPKQDRASSAA